MRVRSPVLCGDDQEDIDERQVFLDHFTISAGEPLGLITDLGKQEPGCAHQRNVA